MTIMTLNTLTTLIFIDSNQSKFCDHKISLDITDIALQMANFLQVINPNKSSFQ